MNAALGCTVDSSFECPHLVWLFIINGEQTAGYTGLDPVASCSPVRLPCTAYEFDNLQHFMRHLLFSWLLRNLYHVYYRQITQAN